MRGNKTNQAALFSYISAEDRVPSDHPLRGLRALVDPVLARLSPQLDRLYARRGRPSIPPEHLLRALLLQVVYTIRSERQLMEQLDYNILYRWFVGIFGRTYDLEIVIDAARHLQERGVDNIQFVFCGDGDYRATWEARSSGLTNVIFTGWVDASEIAYMARISSIGLAAYAAGAPQGLPNKIFEYLAAGLPVLFSLKGEARQLLQENECGIEYDPMARATFLSGLATLTENHDLRIRMGENGKQLFEDSYSSERIYPRLIDHLFGVAQRRVAT